MINLTSGFLSFKLKFVKWFDKTGAPQTLLSADIGANLFAHILIATENAKLKGIVHVLVFEDKVSNWEYLVFIC